MPPTNRTRTRRVGVQETRDVGRLSMVAPSSARDPQAGATAKALSSALGLAATEGQGMRDRADTRAQESALADVASGKTTRDSLADMDPSDRYVYHANKTLREREAKDLSKQLTQSYLEEVPKDATDEEVNAWWIEQVTTNLEGIEDEDINVMAPVLDRARDGILTQHTQQQIADTRTKIEDASMQNTIELFQDPEASYAEQRETLVAQFGKDQANEMLATGLISAIQQTGDPSLVEKAPTHLLNNPKYSAAIAKAYNTAKEAQGADRRMLGRAQSEVEVKRGQYNVTNAREDVADGVYSELEAGNKLAQSITAAKEQIDLEGAATAFLGGKGYLVPQKDRQKAIALAANQFPGREEEAAFRLGIANGVMYEPHEDQIKMATLANEEGFQEGYAVYQQYRTADPKFIGATVPEKQQKLFNAFQIMTDQMGMEPKQAMDRIRNADYEAAGAVMAQRDTREDIDAVYDDVLDIPWDTDELVNTPVLQKELKDLTRTYLAMGTFDAEQATELALKHMTDNRITLDGYAFHRKQGWPEDYEQMSDWVKESLIPEGEDIDDYRVVPDFETKSTNDVILIREGDLPFGAGVLRFNIREQAAQWDANKRDEKRTQAILDHEAEMETLRAGAEKRLRFMDGTSSPGLN